MKIIPVTDQTTLEQCLAIRNDVFTVEKQVPKSVEVDEYDCLCDACDHFLVQVGGENAGAVRCLHRAAHEIQVQRFCLYARFRGGGTGKAMMEYLAQHYRAQGFTKLCLDAKFAVSGFYESCGCRVVSEPFIEANVLHVKMEKDL